MENKPNRNHNLAIEHNKRTLADIRGFLVDMDGTLYISDHLVDGAQQLISLFRQREYPFVFLTNNSAEHALTYRNKLRHLGIHADKQEILTSGAATAHYLWEQTPYRRILLLGTPALAEEFAETGFSVVDRGEADAVVLGFDQTLTYQRLKAACLQVADGAPYYATHPDYTCITDEGLIPDTGAFIVAIESVTGRLPKIIGKPNQEMVQAALSRIGCNAWETAMIGDQLDTDITMANQAGLYGVLVLTGETSSEKLRSTQTVVPDLCLDSVAQLAQML